MTKTVSKFTVMVSLMAIMLLPGIVLARETNFVPTTGELIGTSVGMERVVTTEEGGVNLFLNNGNLVTGYPLFVADSVVVSSPILVDINADAQNEIAFVARNSQGVYTLYIYAPDQTLLASAVLSGATYYDSVALNNSVVVSTLAGDIIRYDYNAGSFYPTTLLTLGQPVGITFVNNTEAVINIPAQNDLRVYTNSSVVWVQSRTIATTEPIIYPVTLSSDLATIYAINRSYQTIAIDRSSGQVKSGFPVDNQGGVVDKPLVTELDENSLGQEVVTSHVDGATRVITGLGTQANFASPQKSFVESSLSTNAVGHVGLFSSLRSTASTIVTNMSRTVSSIFSRIKFSIGNISDTSQPTFSLVTVSAGRITDFVNAVDFTAVTAGTASIKSAEYFVQDKNTVAGGLPSFGTGTALTPADGVFDSGVETLQTAIDTSTWLMVNSPYTISVRAESAAGVWSEVATVEVRVDSFTFKNLTVSESTLPAGGTTPQVATLVLSADSMSVVEDVRIYINHPDAGNGMPARGYFRYFTNGFEEFGTGRGNDVVTLDAAASSISFDAVSKEVTINFVWTVGSGYANVPDNDITYWWPELGQDRGTVNTSFAVTSAQSLVTFNNLSYLSNAVVADGQDEMVVDLVLNTTDEAALGDVNLIINYDQGEGNFRGQFGWNTQNGFQEIGGAYWGNNYVTLLPRDGSNSPAGSQILINQSAGTLTVRYRFTLNSSFGARPVNTVRYYWRDLPSPQISAETFAVTLPPNVMRVVSLDVGKPTHLADGQDMQTIILVAEANTPTDINFASVVPNYDKGDGLYRGHFRWTAVGGFEEHGGSYWGNQHVKLLPEGPVGSANNSYQEINGSTVTFVFRYVAYETYGATADVDVSHTVGNSNRRDYIGPTKVDTNFTVTVPVVQAVVVPVFRSLTISKPIHKIDNQDLQTATLTVATTDPTDLNWVGIVPNYTLGEGNFRGNFNWTATNGFAEAGGNYWGNNHVILQTSGANASERTVDTVNNTVTFVFRWVAAPTYGIFPDIDISYQFGNSVRKNYSSIISADTSFVTEL